MKTIDNDILKSNPQLKAMPYSTPDGYFESMKDGLLTIKTQQQSHKRRTGWIAISAAAAIAAILIIGASLMNPPSINDEFTEEDYLVFSEDFSTEVLYSASTLYAYSETLSDEDIIQYLIDSDWEIDDIE